jgi:hypothetical protein
MTIFSCAPRFILRPTGDQIVERDSVDYAFAETSSCRLEATYLDVKLESTFITFRLSLKQHKNSAVSFDQFRLEGLPFPNLRVDASAPLPHLKKLEEEVANIEKRLNLPMWDGVSEIHDYLVTEKKDQTIEKSKDELADNKKERERLEKRAALLKKEIATIGDRGFLKSMPNSEGTHSGMLIFPARYAKEGDAALILDHPNCKLQLAFAARVSKDSLF